MRACLRCSLELCLSGFDQEEKLRVFRTSAAGRQREETLEEKRGHAALETLVYHVMTWDQFFLHLQSIANKVPMTV